MYNVPSTLGKTVLSNMKQAPMISQVGRSQKGGFHEDLGQVCVPLSQLTVSHIIFHCSIAR